MEPPEPPEWLDVAMLELLTEALTPPREMTLADLAAVFSQTAWQALVERGELRWRTDKAPNWLWNGTPNPEKDGARELLLVVPTGHP